MDLQCNDPLEFGPEIPFPISGVTNVFWEKSLKAGIIDKKDEKCQNSY